MRIKTIIQVVNSDSSILLVARLMSMAAVLLLVKIGGEAATGVFALLTSAGGILAFLLGFGIPANYSYFVGVEKWSHSSITGAGILFTLVFGVVGFFTWLIVSTFLASVLFHDSVSIYSLQLASICIPLAILEAQCLGLLQSFDKLRRYAFCSFFTVASPAVLSLCFFFKFQDYDTIIYACIVGRVISGLICVYCVGQEVESINLKIPLAKIVRLFSYGLKGYVGGMASLANYRLDRLLIGVFADPAVVGTYAVISRIAELGRLLPIAIQTSFAPKASKMSDFQAWNQTKKLLRPISIFTLVFMILLVPVGVILIRLLDIQNASWWHLSLLSFGILFVASSAPIVGYNVASGRPAYNTYSALSGLFVTLILAPILIPSFGILGACIASTVSYMLFGILLFWIFAHGPARRDSVAVHNVAKSFVKSAND